MSGGIAYVLDEKKAFKDNCNQAMVSLESPSYEDTEELKTLISYHAQATGSQKAKRILENFEDYLPQIIR